MDKWGEGSSKMVGYLFAFIIGLIKFADVPACD